VARQKINPVTIGVPDLRGGQQRLDVRFVQFDNMVLELLHYRESTQPSGTGAAWAPAHDHRSPAYPRSLHLCFYLRDDIDFNKFVHDLEAESMRRGITNVRCNRMWVLKKSSFLPNDQNWGDTKCLEDQESHL